MIDNLFGGDDEDADGDADDDEEIGGLFDDPGDGALGSDEDALSGDGGEDLMGGDGDPGGDDLGGEGDLDDDLMGGGGAGGGAADGEVTRRLDELENEVESLSSTVNTVKSENEQLSGSIDDVEENIRKLLEVYEMVTRGVNPFVNENEFGDAFGGAGGGGDGGSMALFGGEEAAEDAEDADIDESVANADADDFFEEDLEDEAGDVVDDEEGVFEEDDSGAGDAADDGTGESDESFDDVGSLDDGGDLDGSDGGEHGDGFDDVDDLDDTFDDVEDSFDGGGGDGGGGKSFEDLKSKYESGGDDDEASGSDAPDAAADAVEGEKPYLREVPGGYAADVVVLDWLEFLVDEAGVDGAARTVAYYEAIDWVSEAAAEHLRTYLRGFGDDVVEDPEPRSWLTVSHHETSLRFISRIEDPSMGLVGFDERLDSVGPGGRAGRGPRDEPASAEAGGHNGWNGSTATAGPELESDGGRTPEEGGRRSADAGGDRTRDAGGLSEYEPAATRRRQGRYGDGDAGDHTCEVGYGGFCWNHEGR